MSQHAQPALGQPLPVPPDFPVRWPNPADAKLTWTFDPMHFPEVVKPLVGSWLGALFDHGFNVAATRYALPVRQRSLIINHYLYAAMTPVGAPPESVLKVMSAVGKLAPGLVKTMEQKAVAGMTQKYQEQLHPVVARLGDYWEQELFPEVRQIIAFYANFALQDATMPQLLSHLDESLVKQRRLLEIHFLIAFPMLMAMGQFDELYRELFPEAGALDAFALLQGFDNQSLRAGDALWALSRQAAQLPVVRQLLEEREAAQVVPALTQTAEGQTFLRALNNFLAEYGQRADKFDALGDTSWIEDPTPVIKNLKDYITQLGRDVAGERTALVAAREQAIAQARAKLQGYPQPVRTQFETALKAAQVGNVLQEDHNYWIDQCGVYAMRRIGLEFGRRFVAAGVLETAEDVLYLLADELSATARALPQLDRKALVRERKAEAQRFAAIRPPSALGTMSAAPPDQPLVRTINKFFGETPLATADARALKGHAGSPGVVRGPAKVIRSLSEAGKLQRGDILVAETTAPPWTPLFATAAGIVTDTGGVLSHCAVVAREYHIPAVVGASKATATITDGMMLEVDGDAGLVKIVT